MESKLILPNGCKNDLGPIEPATRAVGLVSAMASLLPSQLQY